MISTEYTPKDKQARDKTNRDLLMMNAKLYIMKQFDNALVDLEAESWIAIAKEQGFMDLAKEMEANLKFELKYA